MAKRGKDKIIYDVHADVFVTVTKLRRDPAGVLAAAQDQEIVVFYDDKPAAYIVSPEVWGRAQRLLKEAAGNPEHTRQRC